MIIARRNDRSPQLKEKQTKRGQKIVDCESRSPGKILRIVNEMRRRLRVL
jgi:hypothetical protein